MKAQKVLYVLISFPETSETFIVEEIAALKREGCDISVLCLQPPATQANHAIVEQILETTPVRVMKSPEKLQLCKVLWAALSRRPGSFLHSLTRWLRLGPERWIGTKALAELPNILEERYTGICVHFAARNLIAATTLSGFTGIPVSVTTHRFDIIDDPIGIDTARREFGKCANIITISEANRDLMQKKYGLGADQIQVLRCGIRTGFFSHGDDSPPKDFDRNTQCLHLATIGRLQKVKAQHHLVIAMRHLVDNGLRVHLTVIGEGPERARLEQLIEEHELESIVTLAGSLPQNQVQQVLGKSHLYLSTSESEGIPISCMEAMAMQLPIVAFTLPGLEELLNPRNCGILVEQNDVQGLANAISSLAANPPLMQSMGYAAREEILQNYDRTKNAKKLKQLLANAGVSPSMSQRG